MKTRAIPVRTLIKDFRSRLSGSRVQGTASSPSSTTKGGKQSLDIYAILEFLADLKKRKPFGCDVNDLAGFRIPALVAFIILDFEATKATNLHSLSTCQRLFHIPENRVHHLFGLFQREVLGFGKSLNIAFYPIVPEISSFLLPPLSTAGVENPRPQARGIFFLKILVMNID